VSDIFEALKNLDTTFAEVVSAVDAAGNIQILELMNYPETQPSRSGRIEYQHTLAAVITAACRRMGKRPVLIFSRLRQVHV
jgi:hypothetical protein